MIANSLGAFSGAGFSTIPCSSYVRAPAPFASTIPYFDSSLRATLSSATTGASRSSATSRHCRRQGRGQSKMSSGSITANGSLPTASRACSTACPSPSGCRCSATVIRAGLLLRRTISSRSRLPRCSRLRSSSTLQLKCSTTVVLPGLITMMISSMPDATASSTTTSIAGVSTTGKISLGITFDEGSIRVPIPAARMTAFFTFIAVRFYVVGTGESDLGLARFLRGFACDAQRGDGACLQSLDADIAAAFLAITVRAVVDSRHGLADLGQQLALAIAHPQQEVAIRLQRRSVGGIGVGLFRLAVHGVDRALRFLENVAFAAFEQFSKELEVSLPHG